MLYHFHIKDWRSVIEGVHNVHACIITYNTSTINITLSNICMKVCSQPPSTLTTWDSLISEAVRVKVFFFKLHGCKWDCMDRCDMSWCASDPGITVIPFGLTGTRLGHKYCLPHCWSSTNNTWTLLILGWPLKSYQLSNFALHSWRASTTTCALYL